MINLIESPPGHLSGSLVISSLNSDGSRKKDEVLDVNGTINGSNVSLQLNGGATGLTQLFGISTNLVGTLSNETLTLSRGNDTVKMQEMSQKQYEGTLETLDELGRHIATVEVAMRAVQDASSNAKQLNNDLTSYLAWGQERINHVSNLTLWFQKRVGLYRQCLSQIRPQAAAHVPEWRWQGCVLAVQNDKYNRDTLDGAVRSIQLQNQQEVSQLNARIDASRTQFSSAINLMQASCPYASDSSKCTQAVQALRAQPSSGFVSPVLITQFQNLAPAVNNAVSQDIQTANQGEGSLESLSTEIERIYQTAR